ncbi:MAG: radical SAM protein [Candidatus Omnitrophica bacterium]|nr:radical SAM protein [Candidatus Omnitrophota bacterium]
MEEFLNPGFGCLGITEDCMMRCKNCRKWRKDRLVRKWSPLPTVEDWKRCVRDLAQIVDKDFYLNICGGEPFLYPGLFEIIRAASDCGMQTCTASNGYLIDDALAHQIAESGLTRISLSLDGATEQTHDYLRGVRGSYRRVIQAFEHIYRHCPDIKMSVQCVMYDINQDELVDLVKLVHARPQMGSLNFFVAMQPNNTPLEKEWWKGKHAYLFPRDSRKITAIIDELIDMKKTGMPIVNTVSQLRAFQAYLQQPDKFVKTRQCNLDRGMVVSSVGDIGMCFEMGEGIGNIRDVSVLDAWRSAKAAAVRERIRACKKNCHVLINCFDEFNQDFSDE